MSNFIKSHLKLNKLLCLDKYFNFLVDVHKLGNFPKCLLVSGEQGIGKLTLISHFLSLIKDKENYDFKNKKLINNKKITDNFLEINNIISLDGSDKKINIDLIRNLRLDLSKSSFSSQDRYIIINNIELLNHNCLNALLKIVEEPTKKNYFIFIHNRNKELLKTIRSRSIELKIFLSNSDRRYIIENLLDGFSTTNFLPLKYNLSPGKHILYNGICEELEISFNDRLSKNIIKLLGFFKKDKNLDILKFLVFLTNQYFIDTQKNKNYSYFQLDDMRKKIIAKSNEFYNNNISYDTFFNALKVRFNDK